MRIVLSILLFFCVALTYAQDPSFSDIRSTRFLLNPAYVGRLNDLSISSSIKQQWSNVPNKLSYNYLSGAIGCVEKNISFGGNFINTNQGEGLLRSNQLNGIVASMIPIHKGSSREPYTIDLSAAFQTGFGQKSVDWNRLVFSDQLDPTYGAIYATNATPVYWSSPIYNLSAFGVLLDVYSNNPNNTNLVPSGNWKLTQSSGSLGFSMNNVGASGESFLGNPQTRIAARYVAHVSYDMIISDKSHYEFYTGFRYVRQWQQDQVKNMYGITYLVPDVQMVSFWLSSGNRPIQAMNLGVYLFVGDSRQTMIGFNYEYALGSLNISETQRTTELSINHIFNGISSCRIKPKKAYGFFGRPKQICPPPGGDGILPFNINRSLKEQKQFVDGHKNNQYSTKNKRRLKKAPDLKIIKGFTL